MVPLRNLLRLVESLGTS